MPSSSPSRTFVPRLAAWAAVAVGLAGLLWVVPLVRLRPLDAATAPVGFDAVAFAERHWREDLLPAIAEARPIAAVLPALQADPVAACQSLGRSVGLSRSCLYLVRGEGRVVELGRGGCLVQLTEPPGATVSLATGLVFGTAVRDVTGTVDPAARADSRELAAAATELNRLVQERVIAALVSQAAPGQTIEFVACGQVQGRLTTGTPWKLIPLEVVVMEAP